MDRSQPSSPPPLDPESREAKSIRAANRRVALVWLLIIAAVVGLGLWLAAEPLGRVAREVHELFLDRPALQARVDSYGVWAPVFFVIFQVFQVLISPIPGEIVAPAAGYVMGWFPALIYTMIGLSLGSWLAFFLARLTGKGLVERLVAPRHLARMGRFMDRHGLIANLIFFQIPGFPKDFYCYVLGISPINWRIFLLVSSVGRLPANLVLCLQGDLLGQEDYLSFGILFLVTLVTVAALWWWRERVYAWAYRLDHGHAKD